MDEPEVILAAVRAAIASGGLTASAGPLRGNAGLIESLDAAIWRLEPTVTVQTLEVVQASAIVALAGSVQVVGRSVHGLSSSSVLRLSGPVVVVRDEDEWKVSDYLVDGRSIRASIFTSDQTASINGLTVSVLGGQALPRQIRFHLEANNNSGAPVSISRQGFGWAAAGGRW